MGDVDSWYGRVVDVRLDDRCWKLRSVESLNAASWSLREAEDGRVVECSRTIVAGMLRSVVAGKSMSRFLTVCWVNRGSRFSC